MGLVIKNALKVNEGTIEDESEKEQVGGKRKVEGKGQGKKGKNSKKKRVIVRAPKFHLIHVFLNLL